MVTIPCEIHPGSIITDFILSNFDTALLEGSIELPSVILTRTIDSRIIVEFNIAPESGNATYLIYQNRITGQWYWMQKEEQYSVGPFESILEASYSVDAEIAQVLDSYHAWTTITYHTYSDYEKSVMKDIKKMFGQGIPLPY